MTTPDTCPRCGRPFACGVRDAAPCPCTGLRLAPATLERLRREYAGCLCLACLRAEGERDASAAGAPSDQSLA